MKDFNGEVEYKGKVYKLIFNFNVMEAIQNEYGTIEEWGKLSDGVSGEPNAKAVIFGFKEMLNEGLEIESEENGTDFIPLTLKQVGRMITEIGLQNATNTLNETVIESTKSAEKNA